MVVKKDLTGPQRSADSKTPWAQPRLRKIRAGAAELGVGTPDDGVDRRS